MNLSYILNDADAPKVKWLACINGTDYGVLGGNVYAQVVMNGGSPFFVFVAKEKSFFSHQRRSSYNANH